MRITIALSFLAVLCTVEAVPVASTDLEILRLRVRDLKWRVDTVKQRIRTLRDHTNDDTLDEVSLKWNEEEDSFREYADLLLSGIRKDTDAVKAEGKDADSCYKDAIKGIEDVEQEAYKQATKCDEAAKNSIQSNLGFIDNLLSICDASVTKTFQEITSYSVKPSTADTLSTDLDNTFLTCHDKDIYRMQTCIIHELGITENSLKILENDCITAETTIMPVSRNVVKKASNCFKQAFSSSYTSGTGIKMKADECIQQKK